MTTERRVDLRGIVADGTIAGRREMAQQRVHADVIVSLENGGAAFIGDTLKFTF